MEKEKEIFKEQVDGKKPEAVVNKIIEGKLEKFYQDVCLLDQPTIKDPKIKVKQQLDDLTAKLGEKVVVSRFTRYQLGE